LTPPSYTLTSFFSSTFAMKTSKSLYY